MQIRSTGSPAPKISFSPTPTPSKKTFIPQILILILSKKTFLILILLRYSDPDDCARFYICLDKILPREQSCDLGLVFNERSKRCDDPKNVPEW